MYYLTSPANVLVKAPPMAGLLQVDLHLDRETASKRLLGELDEVFAWATRTSFGPFVGATAFVCPE